MTSWADIQRRWSTQWRSLHAAAMQVHGAAIRSNPARYREVVEGFVRSLQESRASLDRIRAMAAEVADPSLQHRATALEARFATLAAGVFADARPAEGVGAAPIVGVAVAGLVVGVAGIAWAVAAYQYAVNLREHTGLLEKELAARVEASRSGRPLLPSSIPPQPSPVGEARRVGMVLLGGLTVAAAAIAVPILLKKAG